MRKEEVRPLGRRRTFVWIVLEKRVLQYLIDVWSTFRSAVEASRNQIARGITLHH